MKKLFFVFGLAFGLAVFFTVAAVAAPTPGDVKVTIDGETAAVRVSPGATVGALIQDLEKADKKEYFCETSPEKKLEPGDTLVLLTKTYREMVKKEAVPYETLIWQDLELAKGYEAVVQEGNDGEKEVVITVVYAGNMVVDCIVVSETVLKEPRNEVIFIGTRDPGAKITESPLGFKYTQEYRMKASAYNSSYLCTGKRPGDRGYGITASGVKAAPGVVAVDPKVIPLGTKLYVEGYGYALAADVGGGIKGNTIDLYFEDYNDCIIFGRRTLDVYVLAEQ